MRLLLDTHALLWAVADPERLPSAVVDQVVDPRNDVLVSVVSAWEVAIKRAKGLLDFGDVTRALLEAHRFRLLGLDLRHTVAVASLPPHHGDPFDRMLVAQARVDDLAVVTRDAAFDAYGVDTVWG